jgi:hypothetical protein
MKVCNGRSGRKSSDVSAPVVKCIHCGRTLAGYIEKRNGFCSELVLCNYRKRMAGNKA